MEKLFNKITDNERLKKQLNFIVELDKLKNIKRRSLLIFSKKNERENENDAEHSWHLSMLALILFEYIDSDEKIDILKIIKMVLIHDIVEIDAGDTYCYDEDANLDKAEREIKAADRIFNILPEDQEEEFRDLWIEFEKRETEEAKFAAALDRIQPLILNYFTDGEAWIKHGIYAEQVIERNKHIRDASEKLWQLAERIIEHSVELGYLKR